MEGYPLLSQVALTSDEKLLENGADTTLYKFKVTATGDDIALYKFSFSTGSSTESATTSTFGLYAFTDSGYSSADTTFSSDGLLNASNLLGNGNTNTGLVAEILPAKTKGATTTYTVPAGASRWFELRATISTVNKPGNTSPETISISLLGDAAFPVNSANLMQKATGVDGDTNDDFIWSPVSTTTQNAIGDLDFTNGYQVKGLPGTNMPSVTLTSTN